MGRINCDRASMQSISSTHQNQENYVAYKGTSGQKLQRAQAHMKELEAQEKEIKGQMQDRMKFSSAKNVYKTNAKLEKIYQEKDALRIKMQSLQEG